jgi:serine/threonine-protein kinase
MAETPPPTSPAEEIGATDAGDRQRGSGARAVPPSSGIMPGMLWGRYRVRSQIGQGGMGTVYAADDSTLGRKVALKLLRYDDPAQVERFLQEAKAQAQVDNQHVCRVYEAGEVRGRPYIAMQFLEGEPLHRAAERLTLEEKIVVMRQVCEGVHAAHRLGLIHRDIKPGNIMVERGEDGQPKAFICDFGLAREMGSRGMTVTGLALGTPEYMAPEQAFGDTARLDRRTDVYGLGATLYEILSGRKPYEGERSAEIFAKLLETDPRPLLEYQPELPVDLQTIVMKCMERDPQRRYETARALHEDLGRFLDGEPIDARPATLTYRLGKKIRKNKTLSVVLAACLVLVIAVAALALRSEWQARKRSLLAQRYGLVAKEIEGVMRYGHLLPLHDTRREGALVRRRMALIRTEMVDEGDLAVGAARYALGRGHLALQEYQAARRELEEAWRLGYRGPDVAYALAQALGELYRRAVEDVRAAEQPAQRAAAEADIDRRFKEPLTAYLAAAAGLQTEAPEYVEGLVAFYDGRYSDAIAKARVTLSRLPWFYEAARLEGDVHETMGADAQDRGDYALAAAEFHLAGQAYAVGLETARSDAALYVAECSRRRGLIEIAQARGEFPQTAYHDAIDFCEKALQANPEDAQAYVTAADVYWRWSEQQVASGADPTLALRKNLEAASEAVRLLPDDARAHHALGIAHTLAAEHAISIGADPAASLAQAESNLARSVALDPGWVWSYNALGWTLVRRAQWELESGVDLRPTVERAAKVLSDGFERAPDFFKPMKNLGAAWRLQAEYEIEHGIEPSASLAKALDAVRRARRVNAEAWTVFELEGEIHTLAAEWALRQGGDAAPALERAGRALAKSLELNPSSSEAERALAAAQRLEARRIGRDGGDPSAALAAAELAIGRALALNANSSESFLEKGRIALQRADSASGSARTEARRAARADFERALALRPGDHAAQRALGELAREAAASEGS